MNFTALRKLFTPEEIRSQGTGHRTNKAFDRYFEMDDDDSQPEKLQDGEGKVLKLKILNGAGSIKYNLYL